MIGRLLLTEKGRDIRFQNMSYETQRWFENKNLPVQAIYSTTNGKVYILQWRQRRIILIKFTFKHIHPPKT